MELIRFVWQKEMRCMSSVKCPHFRIHAFVHRSHRVRVEYTVCFFFVTQCSMRLSFFFFFSFVCFSFVLFNENYPVCLNLAWWLQTIRWKPFIISCANHTLLWLCKICCYFIQNVNWKHILNDNDSNNNRHYPNNHTCTNVYKPIFFSCFFLSFLKCRTNTYINKHGIYIIGKSVALKWSQIWTKIISYRMENGWISSNGAAKQKSSEKWKERNNCLFVYILDSI